MNTDVQTKFTPGEWQARKAATNEGWKVVSLAEQVHLAMVESEHDAQLIAASKDLFEVVSELASAKRAGVGQALMKRANAALAKATGGA